MDRRVEGGAGSLAPVGARCSAKLVGSSSRASAPMIMTLLPLFLALAPLAQDAGGADGSSGPQHGERLAPTALGPGVVETMEVMLDRAEARRSESRRVARERNGVNPGANRVRMALVASLDECRDAAARIIEFMEARFGAR